jgi:hypothetical protein
MNETRRYVKRLHINMDGFMADFEGLENDTQNT